VLDKALAERSRRNARRVVQPLYECISNVRPECVVPRQQRPWIVAELSSVLDDGSEVGRAVSLREVLKVPFPVRFDER
jgi:hypothetical protein